MSQLLIVQGRDPQAGDLFRHGLAAFETICGLRPHECVSGASTSVAVFPRLKAPTPGIVRANAPGEPGWICGVGTWFYGDAVGERALRLIAGRPAKAAENPEAWLRPLDGYFALASEGPTPDDLTIVTDPLGMLHLYTARVGSSRVITTSLLVAAALAGPVWDPEGCRQFLFTGTIFETPRTLFEGIDKLGPAGVFHFRNGDLHESRKYWDLRRYLWDRSETRGDVEEFASALDDILAVVQRHFPHVVMDLTSGFDTRTLLGSMLRRGLRFDVVVNGKDDSEDVVVSRRIGKEFGLTHAAPFQGFPSGAAWWEQAKASLPLCDAEKDVLIYAGTMAVHTRLAETYDVTVNGGMGEILRGHWWELLMPFTGRHGHFDPALVGKRRFGAGGEIPGLLSHPFSCGLAESFGAMVARTNAGLEDAPNTAQMDHAYLTLRNQRWRGRTVSATSRIWPCVTPFEFRRFLELAVSCPPRCRVRNRLSRRLIEHQNARLAALPLEDGCPAMPMRLDTAHRFAPLYAETARLAGRRILLNAGVRLSKPAFPYPGEGGLVGELVALEEVRTLLDPARMETRNLYNAEALRDTLALTRARPSSMADLLGRMLTLELSARTVKQARSLRHRLDDGEGALGAAGTGAPIYATRRRRRPSDTSRHSCG